MAKVGIPSGTTISGVELTSVTITGKVDTLIIDPDTEKTIPTHAFAYNDTYELSFEGIDIGFQSTTNSATVLGKTFKLTSVTLTATAGDFKKVSGRGVYYPKVT
jgi:hypothetical protein